MLQILKRLSAGQPCDLRGVEDYRMLDRAGGIQWPFPTGDTDDRPERCLFEEGPITRTAELALSSMSHAKRRKPPYLSEFPEPEALQYTPEDSNL